MNLTCPNCNNVLIKTQREYRCLNNHTFDLSKSGYVNLLQSQKVNTRNRGDDLQMLRSRKTFLDKGYYLPLVNKMKDIIYDEMHDTILDLGCGEGWYCEQVGGNIIGIDISKHGCDLSAKRNKNMTFVVASSFDLPLTKESIDVVYSVFAPFSATELSKVLKPNGRFIQVYPLLDHLMGLKEAIYDEAYANDDLPYELEGFSLESTYEVHDQIELLDNETIKSLFAMTPYVHRTKSHEMNRRETLTHVSTQIAFGIRVYRKLSTEPTQ